MGDDNIIISSKKVEMEYFKDKLDELTKLVHSKHLDGDTEEQFLYVVNKGLNDLFSGLNSSNLDFRLKKLNDFEESLRFCLNEM